MPDVPPTNVENETSPVFVVGTSKHEEDLNSDTWQINILWLHSYIN